MSNLTKAAIEEITEICNMLCKNGHDATVMDAGMRICLTNPAIYQAAGLMSVDEALEFAEWVQWNCIRYDGDWVLGGKLYTTTTDLLTIFRQQKEVK